MRSIGYHVLLGHDLESVHFGFVCFRTPVKEKKGREKSKKSKKADAAKDNKRFKYVDHFQLHFQTDPYMCL